MEEQPPLPRRRQLQQAQVAKTSDAWAAAPQAAGEHEAVEGRLSEMQPGGRSAGGQRDPHSDQPGPPSRVSDATLAEEAPELSSES